MTGKKSKNKIIILYGYAGNEETHWQTWLAKECRNFQYEVIYPDFPNPNRPNLSAWTESLNFNSTDIDENTIIVGHSLGCAFAFQLLQNTMTSKIRKLILVAPTNWTAIKQTELNFLKPFYENIDLEYVKEKTNEVEIYCSNNDPYVEENEAKEWIKKLAAKVFVFQNGGHLNVASGFTSFPDILNSILQGNP